MGQAAAINWFGTCTPALEIVYWIAQIALAVIAFFAAGFAYKQVQVVRLHELLKYIENENVRKARRVVLLDIRLRAKQDWWNDDTLDQNERDHLDEASATVAASYDILGRIIRFERRFGRRDRVGDFFLKNWADSIVPSYDVLRPWLQHRRETVPTAYKAFDEMAEKARN